MTPGKHAADRHDQAESSFAARRAWMPGYRVTCPDVVIADRFTQSS